jgi:hypothetical protein
MDLNPDFSELLRTFNDAGVRYLSRYAEGAVASRLQLLIDRINRVRAVGAGGNGCRDRDR